MNETESPSGLVATALRELKLIDFGDTGLTEDGWQFLTNKQEGYNLPWESLRNDFKIIKGELTLVSGYTGQGKSEMVTHIALDAISQGAKAMIASLEMTPGQLQARITHQATGIQLPSQEYHTHVSQFYRDKLRVFDTRGIADINEILEGCRLLNNIFGHDVFIFDNLMMLDSSTDDYNKQFHNAQRISEFTKKFKVCSLLVAHSKKPREKLDAGKFSADFNPPGIYDVMGASSVANLVDNHISITINQAKLKAASKLRRNIPLTDSELKAMEFGDAAIKRDKKREQGEYFTRPLYYDRKFHRLKDYETQKLSPYVEYSNLNKKVL